jgi:hypothetical protein
LSTFVTWDTATQIAATTINVSHIGSDNNDYDVFLALLKTNDYIIVQSSSNSDVYQKFLISGTPTIIPNDYVEIPVTIDSYGSSPTNFSNNDPILVIIQSIGPEGPAGPANTLSIGTVTVGDIGVASATITGSAPNQTLDFVIPTGAVGPSIESLIITETTTARTLALTDTNQYIRCTHVSQTSITVPPESVVPWTAGTTIYFRRGSTAGAISLAAGSGVTINGGSLAPTILADQNFAIKKVDTNIWDFI